jgi:hypothetical protein
MLSRIRKSVPDTNQRNHFSRLAIQTLIAVDQSTIHNHGCPGLHGESLIMDQSTEDAGTIAALMIRMKEYRLPRAKKLLEKVNGGDALSNEDISFLKRVYNDCRSSQPLVKRRPEYHELIGAAK